MAVFLGLFCTSHECCVFEIRWTLMPVFAPWAVLQRDGCAWSLYCNTLCGCPWWNMLLEQHEGKSNGKHMATFTELNYGLYKEAFITQRWKHFHEIQATTRQICPQFSVEKGVRMSDTTSLRTNRDASRVLVSSMAAQDELSSPAEDEKHHCAETVSPMTTSTFPVLLYPLFLLHCQGSSRSPHSNIKRPMQTRHVII